MKNLMPAQNVLFWEHDGLALVYEDGANSLSWYWIYMNFFETFLDYWQWRELMKIHIGMEQVKSPILIQTRFISYLYAVVILHSADETCNLFWLLFECLMLKMITLYHTETSVTLHQSTQSNIPQNLNLQHLLKFSPHSLLDQIPY